MIYYTRIRERKLFDIISLLILALKSITDLDSLNYCFSEKNKVCFESFFLNGMMGIVRLHNPLTKVATKSWASS